MENVIISVSAPVSPEQNALPYSQVTSQYPYFPAAGVSVSHYTHFEALKLYFYISNGVSY